MTEPTDSPAKPLRTWRPMILSIVLIVGGAALVWGVAANRRRIEAHYWLWQARRAAETGDVYAVAARADRRGFCLLRLDLDGVATEDGAVRVYCGYKPVRQDLIMNYYVFISSDGGKTWRREWGSLEEDKSGLDFSYDLRYEPNGFSVWRKDGQAGVLVRRFDGYPEFKIEDHVDGRLIPPDAEANRDGKAPK